jgi:hypothetical protein
MKVKLTFNYKYKIILLEEIKIRRPSAFFSRGFLLHLLISLLFVC